MGTRAGSLQCTPRRGCLRPIIRERQLNGLSIGNGIDTETMPISIIFFPKICQEIFSTG